MSVDKKTKYTKSELKKRHQNIKAFFIDLDGTLLDEKDASGRPIISVANLSAINKAQKEGKYIIISTGRALDAQKYLQQVNSPYAILSNGAQVFVKDKIVASYKLTVRQVLQIYDFAWRNKLSFKFQTNKAFGCLTLIQKLIASHFGFIPQDNYNFEMHKEYHKMVLWGKSKKKMQIIQAEIMKKIPDISIVTSAKGLTLEITNINATKGKGNELIWSKYLNLKKSETVHLGDTMNDSTASGHVGGLIAMKNSDKNLKKIADFIGPNCKNGGVAKILSGKYK